MKEQVTRSFIYFAVSKFVPYLPLYFNPSSKSVKVSKLSVNINKSLKSVKARRGRKMKQLFYCPADHQLNLEDTVAAGTCLNVTGEL